MLVRWDPFEEMNRLHDHFFSGRGLAKQAFRVAVDIREEDDAFHHTAFFSRSAAFFCPIARMNGASLGP